ncbi:MAG: sensor domain-containing diguanylate cyclase [Ruminiclostridium sp.]|nr:sensor domain-containing diguanylate cyclase [Ruminiclostridium sp.]
MKNTHHMRLIPLYILTFALFSLTATVLFIILAVNNIDLIILCWLTPLLAILFILFDLAVAHLFKRAKKHYDDSLDQILTAFSPDKAEALMQINDGEPTPEQITRWVCEQTEASSKAADLISVTSAQHKLSNEIFWQITDDSAKLFCGNYWSHTYGYNDLDKTDNIRNLLSEDTKVDFDHAMKTVKDGTTKSFSITGNLRLNPQKTVKVIIKGSPVEDEKHRITIVGTVHDIQEEMELTDRIQAGRIKIQFLLSDQADVIYDVNIPDNKLNCLTPQPARELFGMGSMFDFDGERRPFWERIHPDYREGFIDRFFDYNHMMIMPEHKMTYEYKIKNVNGDYIWVEHQAQVTSTRHGTVTGVVGRIKSINEQKKDELRLLYQPNTDSLTGAYVRSAVEAEFNANLGDGLPRAVVVFNINKFHFINNEYGFKFGDLVLQYFVGALWERQRGLCAVGRVDNDTFVIAMHEADDRQGWPKNQIEALFKSFIQPVKIEGKLVNITVSAGGSQVCADKDFNELYEQAEKALNKCRQTNAKFENAYELYTEEL